VVTLSPRSIAHEKLIRGLDSARAGDWSAAELAFTEAISRAPGEWEAYVNRGNVRQERGDLEGAASDFGRAIGLDATHVAPYFNRGNVRAMLGDLAGAIADLTDAIRIDPSFAKAYERRGHILQRLGDDARAEEDFSRAIELAPGRHDAYAHRAAVRALRGAVDEALADCSAALDLVPPSARQRDAIVRLKSALTRAQDEVAGRVRRPQGHDATLCTFVEAALGSVGAEFKRDRKKAPTYRVAAGGADVRLVVDEKARAVALELVVPGVGSGAAKRAEERAARARAYVVRTDAAKKVLVISISREVPRRESHAAFVGWIERSLRAADRRARALLAR